MNKRLPAGKRLPETIPIRPFWPKTSTKLFAWCFSRGGAAAMLIGHTLRHRQKTAFLPGPGSKTALRFRPVEGLSPLHHSGKFQIAKMGIFFVEIVFCFLYPVS